MAIRVELRRHCGTQQTQLGPVEVEFAQFVILAAGEEGRLIQVGYVGTQPGAPINFLRQPDGPEWPEPIKQAVRDEVARQLGEGVRKEGQPPAPMQAPAPEQAEFDEDDD